MNPRARISRVHTSWKVRVPGHRPAFFADGRHGGEQESLAAATRWRDEHWDGHRAPRKLTHAQREEIITSRELASVLAERYGISRQYVWDLWNKNRSARRNP